MDMIDVTEELANGLLIRVMRIENGSLVIAKLDRTDRGGPEEATIWLMHDPAYINIHPDDEVTLIPYIPSKLVKTTTTTISPSQIVSMWDASDSLMQYYTNIVEKYKGSFPPRTKKETPKFETEDNVIKVDFKKKKKTIVTPPEDPEVA